MTQKVKMIVFYPEKCKGHLDCERACSQIHFKDDTGGDHSAIRIIKENGTYKMTNCNQCGLCIDMCPVQAIKRLPNGIVILNKDTCIGCQSCVAFCPEHVMRRAEGQVVPFKCISCGACVRACPEGALELIDVELSDIERTVYHTQGVCE